MTRVSHLTSTNLSPLRLPEILEAGDTNLPLAESILVVHTHNPDNYGRFRLFRESIQASGMTVHYVSRPTWVPNSGSSIGKFRQSRLMVGLARALATVLYLIQERVEGNGRKLFVKLASLILLGTGVRKLVPWSGPILVVDPLLLPIVITLKPHSRVIHDIRDLYWKQNEGSLFWRTTVGRAHLWVARRYFNQVARLSTFSQEAKSEIEKTVASSDIRIIWSVPFDAGLQDVQSPTQNGDVIRIVYWGRITRNRKIANVVRAISALQNVELAIFAKSSLEIMWLRLLLGCYGPATKKVSFFSGTKSSQTLPSLSRYDLGLAYFAPETTNLRVSLPNKFFEYLTAGLPVIVHSDSSMAKIVGEYDVGVIVSGTVKNLSIALSNLSRSALLELKLRVHAERHRILRSQHQEILDLVL